jgi:Ca2+-binding RTX toxin-like protein
VAYRTSNFFCGMLLTARPINWAIVAGDDDIYGGFDADLIVNGRGDDNIFANGGMDTLVGGRR